MRDTHSYTAYKYKPTTTRSTPQVLFLSPCFLRISQKCPTVTSSTASLSAAAVALWVLSLSLWRSYIVLRKFDFSLIYLVFVDCCLHFRVFLFEVIETLAVMVVTNFKQNATWRPSFRPVYSNSLCFHAFLGFWVWLCLNLLFKFPISL